MRSIAFFNNKGGVGKTTLVSHLAWMYAELGVRVVVADLDPQANLTSIFLSDERLETLWNGGGATVYSPVAPLLEGTGGIENPSVTRVSDRLGLLAGDMSLAGFEDELSSQWPDCLDGKPRAFRVITAFHETLRRAAEEWRAELVLIDVGPNLGALNRAALVAARQVVIPLAPDLYSLQGLRNLGPALRQWRAGWAERLAKNPGMEHLPSGDMQPAGYVAMQHAVRLDRPVKAYQRWMARIPGEYRHSVLDEGDVGAPPVEKDPCCLALLKHYRSLMPLAMEVRKPMFLLKPADGAIGAHGQAVRDCYDDFRYLAHRIAAAAGLSLHTESND